MENEKVYPVYLTELEISKVIGLINVVIEPLKKASNKAVIPKQKREAQQTLEEVKVILNKFKIEKENGEDENGKEN